MLRIATANRANVASTAIGARVAREDAANSAAAKTMKGGAMI